MASKALRRLLIGLMLVGTAIAVASSAAQAAFPGANGRIAGYSFVNAPVQGIYTTKQDGNSFDVREAGGGTSNIPFTYRIVARRKDIEGKRLARLHPGVKNNLNAMRAKAANENRSSLRASVTGETPLVPIEPIVPNVVEVVPGQKK